MYARVETGSLSPTSTHDEMKEHSFSEDGISEQIRRSWLRRHWISIGVHSLLIVANVVIYIAAISRTWDPSHAFTPLYDAIEYERRSFEAVSIRLYNGSMNANKPTDFAGDPRPALEAAWKQLTKNQNIRLTDEDLAQADEDDSVVQLTDGSGSYGTLTVFHGLHCIERIHRYIHFDHYYASFSDEEKVLLEWHLEHCLDWLRQYLTCNPDTTPIMMHWIAESTLPVAKVDGGKHSCAKWERIDEWAGNRTFVPSSENIKHPIYGDPYSKDANLAVGIINTKGQHYVSSNGTVYA